MHDVGKTCISTVEYNEGPWTDISLSGRTYQCYLLSYLNGYVTVSQYGKKQKLNVKFGFLT